jgi:hypothetical protein
MLGADADVPELTAKWKLPLVAGTQSLPVAAWHFA